MLAFCGIDKMLIDSNGRLKLSPKVLNDFAAEGEIVLYCLPEGALGIYPEETYLAMRKADEDRPKRAASSMIYRRMLRQFGSGSVSAKISPQGRITLPQEFRMYAGLECGKTAIAAGCEIGIEIWNEQRWKEEQELILKYMREQGRRELDGGPEEQDQTGKTGPAE